MELSEIPLFHGMDEDALKAAAAHPLCTNARYKQGETIYSPTAFRRSLGALCSGCVQVEKGGLVVSLLTAGEVFGAAALFNESEEYATVLTALEDSEILFFPQPLVLELLRNSAPFMENYVRYLSGRIHFLSQRLGVLSAGSAEEKVAQFFLSNMDPAGRVHISATALTRRLNISRATLYRVFDSMEAAGVIRREGKTITVSDVRRIRTHCH